MLLVHISICACSMFIVLAHMIAGISPKTVCVGLARIGSPSQQLVVDTLENMSKVDLGKPLHSLVIVGEVHPLEQTMLNIVCKTETK